MLIGHTSAVSRRHRSDMVGILLLHFNLSRGCFNRSQYGVQGVHSDWDAINGTEVKSAAQHILVCRKQMLLQLKYLSRDRQGPKTVCQCCIGHSWFSRAQKKQMLTLKSFYFFNIVPFDFMISKSILSLKSVLELIHIPQKFQRDSSDV